MSARAERWHAVAVAGLALLAGVFAVTDLPLGVFHDDAHYAVLARELAAGRGYHYANLPGAPAATHFPPLWPMLLALVWRVVPAYPANLVLLKAVNPLLGLGAALALRALARRAGLGPWTATAIAAGTAWTVPILFLNGLLFSETAFTLGVLVALLAASRADRVDAGWGDGALVGVALGLATLTRTAGVALLAGVVWALLLRRRWRPLAAALAAAGALLVPWQGWVASRQGATPPVVAGMYGSYGDWVAGAIAARGTLGFLVDVARTNLPGFGIVLELTGLADAPTLLRLAAMLAMVAMLGLGWRPLARRLPAVAWTLPPYLVLVLLWPGPPDRFLWPLWGLLLLTAALGLREAWHWVPADEGGRGARALLLLGGGALLAATVAWHLAAWPARGWESGERGNARLGRAVAAVVAELPADARVASDFDAMAHLATGRPVAPLLTLTALEHVRPRRTSETAAMLAATLDTWRPTHVVVGDVRSFTAAERLRRGPHPRLRLVRAWGAGVLLYAPTER